MRGLTRRATATTALVTATGLLLGTPAIAASEWDIDTTGDGTETIYFMGVPDTATYGQTITVPDGPGTLESFSIDVIDFPTGIVFRGALQAWDEATSRATGDVLYLSDPVSSVTGTGRETVTFTPDIDITPGTYVIYATVSYDYEDQEAAQGRWAADGADPYAGGRFVFMNNGGDEGRLTTEAWQGIGAQYDAQFTVVFAAPVVPPVTPPPATPVIVAPAYTG